MPVLLVGPSDEILFVNPAAEQFFDMGAGLLVRQRLEDLLPFGSPVFGLLMQARERNATVSERAVDLSTPRHGERVADVVATPLARESTVMLTLQERGLALRLDRQLMHRGSARSLH